MKSLGFVSCFGRRVAWEGFIHVKLKLYMNTEISGKKTMERGIGLRFFVTTALSMNSEKLSSGSLIHYVPNLF